jgi:prepilin-type N-terminal cleavage/methylation domain-containing protein
MKVLSKSKEGFSLIELLVVIAILAILLVIVLVAINPAKQTRDARNVQRSADVLVILNAVGEFFVEHGEFPGTGNYTDCSSGSDVIGTSGQNIANTSPTVGSGVVPNFVAALPKDPSPAGTDADTGYEICDSTSNRITILAPNTEGGIATISATR